MRLLSKLPKTFVKKQNKTKQKTKKTRNRLTHDASFLQPHAPTNISFPTEGQILRL